MQEIFESINTIINQIGKMNVIIALVTIIALIVIYFISRAVRIKKYKKIILEDDSKINSIKSLPLQYRLNRVKKITVNDESLIDKYEKFVVRYEELDRYLKEEVATRINDIDEQLYFHRLKNIKKNISELESAMKEYEQNAHDLLDDLELVTEIENEQRIRIIKLKENYRDLTNRF